MATWPAQPTPLPGIVRCLGQHQKCRSIANARKIVGYEPRDDSGVVYADEIRELMLEPARQTMVQGEARGGKGSR